MTPEEARGRTDLHLLDVREPDEWEAGNRSEAATRGLRTLGYAVENLEGGVTAWKRAGLPLEAEGGGPGRVI